ncbi:ferritin-like protein [Mesorhizobium sp. M0012]|uniref:ferritin-like domain-containing protein n=1 Tax=Mesorhizobium sp. M0012 TaxID=2956840 RepID=UPI0033355418
MRSQLIRRSPPRSFFRRQRLTSVQWLKRYPCSTYCPVSAEEEAVALLRTAAEVEGALMAQYLFAAGSLLPDVSVTVAGFDHPILSNDWYDLIRDIAKQEMGHLITVQNVLLSMGAAPHVDRENFPLESPLYPFPFKLQPVRLDTLAKYVCAEAPREIPAADQSDYAEAVAKAGAAVGEVPRSGQLYERLFWLFQDGDEPQQPWPNLKNPFPSWPNWHVDPAKIGLNQDRQGDSTEWRGSDSGDSPDSAVYVLQVRDKATAREAVYKVGLQGEGPVGEPGATHFDKFLRLYREQRAVARQPGAPAFARNQAEDPRVGLGGSPTITHPEALVWAQLANTRYQMLLMDIALAVSVGLTGTALGTAATRKDFYEKDFYDWAFTEMIGTIKPLAGELRQMPLSLGGSVDDPRAGIPYELPNQTLPSDMAGQLQRSACTDREHVRPDAKAEESAHPDGRCRHGDRQ